MGYGFDWFTLALNIRIQVLISVHHVARLNEVENNVYVKTAKQI